MSLSHLKAVLRQPPVSCRVKPFWFWNGEMDREEISHQLREMADKGLGGALICARQGMTVPYLSQAWFDLVSFACDEAEQLGLETWLYDEFPYPSGMSGGEVLMEHPEAEHTVLRHKRLEAAEGHVSLSLGAGRMLAAQARPLSGAGGAIDLSGAIGILQPVKIYQRTGLTAYTNQRFFSYGPERVLETDLPEGLWQVDVYTEDRLGDFKYYGGYFDPCSPEAVRTFLRTTHERYRQALGERLGRSVKGMFSDEVGLLSPIPWSRRLPENYLARYGEPVTEALLALHDSSRPHAYRLRYQLYHTAHELFRESYHRQTADWCREHQLLYATEVPSMRLGTQRYSTVIGGDTGHEKLGKPLDQIWDSRLPNLRSNARAVASLARQLDRPFAMIESFHSVGWSMTLQDAKWMIDRMSAQGINMYVFHAFYYTIQDITKHDAPPSQFLQNPYWPHYRLLADYAARMCALVKETESDSRVALLDPEAAFWTRLGNPFHGHPYAGESKAEEAELNALRDGWLALTKRLIRGQVGFDHLDAELLQTAEVADGELRLGRAAYRVLVLPDCPCMEEGALRKLERFVAEGGCLIGFDTLPRCAIDGSLTDAETEAAWAALMEQPGAHRLPTGSEEVCGFCRMYASPTAAVDVAEGSPAEVISSVRLGAGGEMFVFVSNQGGGSIRAEVRPGASLGEKQRWRVEAWDLAAGDTHLLAFLPSGGAYSLPLGPYESRWLCFAAADAAEACPVPAPLTALSVPMGGLWEAVPQGQNIHRLSGLQMSLDGQRWAEAREGTFIEQCAETSLLGGDALRYESTFGTPRHIRPAYPVTCLYRLRFTLREAVSELFLLMDEESVAGERTISVNGQSLPERAWQPARVNDQHNRAADIVGLARVGENELLIRCSIRRDEEGLRDPLYLWGRFGVFADETKTGWALGAMPDGSAPDAPWPVGFPFYSGTMTYSRSFDLCEMECAQPQAALREGASLRLAFSHPMCECLEVRLNGVSLGVQAWTPYAWTCPAGLLRDEGNQVEVLVTNTLSSMLDGSRYDLKSLRIVPILPGEG